MAFQTRKSSNYKSNGYTMVVHLYIEIVHELQFSEFQHRQKTMVQLFHTTYISEDLAHCNRPLVKSVLEKYFFFISQPKPMLWVLKRTV